uniref:Uncharacterized protein n=1 Tax=Lepeophtheirus salmonis TaxID=72036 RepID=A0A0K2U3A3_LEPSM
MGLNMDPKSEV